MNEATSGVTCKVRTFSLLSKLPSWPIQLGNRAEPKDPPYPPKQSLEAQPSCAGAQAGRLKDGLDVAVPVRSPRPVYPQHFFYFARRGSTHEGAAA